MNRKHERGSIVTILSALVIVSILGYFFVYNPYVERREAEVNRVAEEQTKRVAEEAKRAAEEAKNKIRTEAITRFQNLVKANLFDPGSAQFQNIRLNPDGTALCGQVNAKNRMGGYVGFRQFLVTQEKGVEMPNADDPDIDVVYEKILALNGRKLGC